MESPEPVALTPAAVLQESLEALAAIFGEYACQNHATAGNLSPGTPLQDAVGDTATILFAMSHALRQVAVGDGDGLDLLAGFAAAWLGEQRVAIRGNAKFIDLAMTDPTTN